MPAAAAYLESLNPEQRRAVEHGATGGGPFAPLLVIAGAGSGKTNTLAHRVAHLIVKGADPRRILLMTFSRRAASEMAKRVQRIAAEVLGRDASVITPALSPKTLRAIRSTRAVISAAARRENVIRRTRLGSAPPTIRCATRWASVLVLPEPAPAITSSGANGPGPAAPCSTARRCSGLRLSR